MKFIHAIAIGALSCVSFAAIAQQQPQQQSLFGTPALATQATVGGPVVLNLTGVTVTDVAGQPIGPIQHLLLSPAGCADLAVVSLGGQKLVAVPWQLMSGAGVARADTEVATRATFALKTDRALLLQAPPITSVAQLSQPQVIQQVHAFFTQVQQQPQQQSTSAGGTSSQTDVNVGVGGSITNRTGLTNAGVGIGITNANTNQTGILSPTGPTNAAPGRPAFETNRPGQPSITPGRPANRPPLNRPPAGRPPTNTPPTGASPAGTPGGATPNDPNQP